MTVSSFALATPAGTLSGDHRLGAGLVAADPQAAEQLALGALESKPAAEDHGAAWPPADRRIISRQVRSRAGAGSCGARRSLASGSLGNAFNLPRHVGAISPPPRAPAGDDAYLRLRARFWIRRATAPGLASSGRER
jgi:hypothetical protein